VDNLLLLHGAASTQAQFDTLTPLLRDHFTVHTLDFDGHGQHAASKQPFRMESFSADVLHYMDVQGITQANIFGYSMGGYVGMVLALTQPARIGKVFTLATKYVWTLEVAAKEVSFLDADKILAKVPHYAESLQQQHGDHWRAMLDKTKTLLTGLGEHNLLESAALQRIETPVRIGIGDRDMMVSIEESLAVYRALPRGEFQVFPHTPHPFDKVSPALLAEAIRQFFTP
jgi:pimeloyl-ACP methyl ester carboxylesterase